MGWFLLYCVLTSYLYLAGAANLDFRLKFRSCVSPTNLLTETVRQTILNKFNHQRQMVAKMKDQDKFPVAYPMRDLVWDSLLTENANTLAMKCPLIPLIYFNITDLKNQKVGLSIALKIWDQKPSRQYTVDRLIRRYSSSAAAMKAEKIYSLIRKYETGKWDTAFQIIWANTTKVGCSYLSLKNNDSDGIGPDTTLRPRALSSKITFYVLACYFSPAGCQPQHQVYKINTEATSPDDKTEVVPLGESPAIGFDNSAKALMILHLYGMLLYEVKL